MFSKYLAPVLALAASAVNAECFDWDKPALHCYNGGWDTPQDLTIDDVTYVGNYLRAHGLHSSNFLTMPAEAAQSCEEWELYTHGTVKVLAKHITPGANSSVLYEDIANTIDGGASRDEVGPAIIQCLADGGFAGVIVDTKNPAYNTEEYKEKKLVPEGILIKVVTTVIDEL